MVPGAPLTDAPVRRQGQPGWLLRCLGPGFTLLVFGQAPAWTADLPDTQVLRIGPDLEDAEGLIAQRLDATPGTAYLLRPDQHVCARWRQPSEAQVRAALRRACALA